MSQEKELAELLIDTAEAATIMGIKEGALQARRVHGIASPTYFKVGKAVLYVRSTVERWVAENGKGPLPGGPKTARA